MPSFRRSRSQPRSSSSRREEVNQSSIMPGANHNSSAGDPSASSSSSSSSASTASPAAESRSSNSIGSRLRDSMRRMSRFRFSYPSAAAAEGDRSGISTSSTTGPSGGNSPTAAGSASSAVLEDDRTASAVISRNGTLVRVSRNRATNAIVTELVEALVNSSPSSSNSRNGTNTSRNSQPAAQLVAQQHGRQRPVHHSSRVRRDAESLAVSSSVLLRQNDRSAVSSSSSRARVSRQSAGSSSNNNNNTSSTSRQNERRAHQQQRTTVEHRISSRTRRGQVSSASMGQPAAESADSGDSDAASTTRLGASNRLTTSSTTTTLTSIVSNDSIMNDAEELNHHRRDVENNVDSSVSMSGTESNPVIVDSAAVLMSEGVENDAFVGVGDEVEEEEEEDERDLSPSAAAAQRALQRGRRSAATGDTTGVARITHGQSDLSTNQERRESEGDGRRSSSISTSQQHQQRPQQRQQGRQQLHHQEDDERRRHPAGGGRLIEGGSESSLRRRGSFAEESWPHWFSSTLACVSCALNTFNICRFALLANYYGGSFVVQFCLLTAAVGLPMTAFFLASGQALAAGAMGMWRVCPIFRGVGVALLFAQALLGVLASAPVSWLFAYLRDSFVSAWAECFPLYRECPPLSKRDPGKPVADYFHGRVLDRIAPDSAASSGLALDHIKFEPAFHLAILWMLVLLIFSRGLRSYGKMVYFVVLIPIIGLCLVSGQLIAIGRQHGFSMLTSVVNRVWTDGFRSGEQWVAVAREVFFIWGLNGCAVMQMASHNPRHRRVVIDVILIAILVMGPLMLATFACGACLQILTRAGFAYVPSSFETRKAFEFLLPYPESLGIETRANSLFAGVVLSSSRLLPSRFSGYTPLRFATEIFPAVTVQLGPRALSPFWSMLFYFSLSVLGMGTLLVIWRTVVEMFISLKPSLLRPWDVTISFLACFSAYLLALPFTSEIGIHVVYFWDSCVGSSWWIMVLYVLLLLGLLYVRGKPYGAEDIARIMFPAKGSCWSRSMRAFFAFVWTLILPIVLLATAVVSFRYGTFRQMLHWGGRVSYEGENWPIDETSGGSSRIFVGPVEHSSWSQQYYSYWGEWARHIGGWVQMAPLLMVPVVAAIQSIRYLSCGSTDIFARMKTLYRPSINRDGRRSRDGRTRRDRRQRRQRRRSSAEDGSDAEDGFDDEATVGRLSGIVTRNPNAEEGDDAANDPPPKYTPPPSYSTATGAMLAKYLRASFRRSVRRVQTIWQQMPRRGSTASTATEACCSVAGAPSTSSSSIAPPPSYAAIALVENGSGTGIANPSYISDDPSGNDSISEVPRESHYTMRAAEMIARRASAGSPRSVTPPPDYDGIFALHASPELAHLSLDGRRSSSPAPSTSSFSFLPSFRRRSNDGIATLDSLRSSSSASGSGSLKFLRSLRHSFQVRQFPQLSHAPARRAHSTELVSVSTINIERIDSTDA